MNARTEFEALIKGRSPDSNIFTRQVGHQAGVTFGGTFTDDDGEKWYLKQHRSPEHAIEEHLANQVYRETGHEAPHSKLLHFPGRGHVYASKYVPKFETLADSGHWQGRDKAAHQFLSGAAVDALINMNDHHSGNVGVMRGSDGNHRAVRVDNGGGFFHNAMGQHRSTIPGVSDYDPVNAHASFYAMQRTGRKDKPLAHRDIIEPGVKKINGVLKRHGSWQAFVDRHVPMALKSHREELAGFLNNRHLQLLQHTQQLRKDAGVNVADNPVIHGVNMHEVYSTASITGPQVPGAGAQAAQSTRFMTTFKPETPKTHAQGLPEVPSVRSRALKQEIAGRVAPSLNWNADTSSSSEKPSRINALRDRVRNRLANPSAASGVRPTGSA